MVSLAMERAWGGGAAFSPGDPAHWPGTQCLSPSACGAVGLACAPVILRSGSQVCKFVCFFRRADMLSHSPPLWHPGAGTAADLYEHSQAALPL